MSQPRRIIQDLLFGHPARVLVGVAFGIDVLEGGAERLPYCQRGAALGWDQDQFASLPLGLELRQFKDIGVEFGERAAEEEVRHWMLQLEGMGDRN